MATNELMMPQYGILIVKNPEIEFSKIDELRVWLRSVLSKYDGLIIDETQCKEIKKEIAALNKIKAEIKQYAKNVVSQLSAPIAKIEDVVSGITDEIDSTYSALKAQVDGYAEKAREEKKARVLEMFENLCKKFSIPPWSIEIKKTWTNASTSYSKIDEELTAIVRTRVSEIMKVRETAAQQPEAPQPAQQAVPQAVQPDPSAQTQPQQQEPTTQGAPEEQKKAPEKPGPSRERVEPLISICITMVWDSSVDAEIRDLLRRVKSLAVNFAARRVALPNMSDHPFDIPVQTKNVKFCGQCESYDTGKKVCLKTGEQVQELDVCTIS